VCSCSLRPSGFADKESDTIYRLPWNYSFLRRTLKRASCCDCPEQIIGIYLLEPTNYSSTCLHAAVLCSCGTKIWVLYCAQKPSGRLLRPVPRLLPSFHQRLIMEYQRGAYFPRLSTSHVLFRQLLMYSFVNFPCTFFQVNILIMVSLLGAHC
jgi:hypothetical protein